MSIYLTVLFGLVSLFEFPCMAVDDGRAADARAGDRVERLAAEQRATGPTTASEGGL